MYRFAWGNGPVDCATYRGLDLPNTVCHVADSFCASMTTFHRRVQHPGQDAWTWFVLWRDLKASLAGTPEYGKVKGLGLDEVIPNTTDLPALKKKMQQVWHWCDEAKIPRPDWVVSITPGNPVAVDYIVGELAAAFGSRLYWAPQTYIGCYKAQTGETDLGLGQAKILVDRLRAAKDQYARTIVGFNHSHYLDHCAYYNVYGNDARLNQRNQAVYDAWAEFARHATDGSRPFGSFVWTPGYSSPLTRGDVAAVLTAVGG